MPRPPIPSIFVEESPGDPDTDWLYDDGRIAASCTPGRDAGVLDIWLFGLKEGVVGGQGHARAALETMAAHFPSLHARSVQDDREGESFWRKMGAEGLVASMETLRKGRVDLTQEAIAPRGRP